MAHLLVEMPIIFARATQRVASEHIFGDLFGLEGAVWTKQ